jgi:ATP-dependent Lhr-like helicase
VNIYATDKWSLLQSLACWLLYKADFLEPIKTAKKPYDILLHQLLSIVKQLSGCSKNELLKRLKTNSAFQLFEDFEINSMIEEAIKSDYLEVIQHELILGIEGEKIVNTREFYSVFKTEPNFKVIFSGKKIGDIPFSPQIKIDENILLAAKIWKIVDIDFNAGKIIVIPALDGKKPMFFGGGGNIHPRIREEMLRILKSDEVYQELDKNSNSVLEELRNDFKRVQINDFKYDKPFINKEGKLIIYSFTGTKVNRSLQFLIHLVGFEVSMNDHESSLELYINISDFEKLIEKTLVAFNNIDYYLQTAIEENESLLSFSKWGNYLPINYKCEILKERYFDFESAVDLISNIKLVESN